MSSDVFSFSGSESARRKTYAIVGAGVCVLVFVMVYAFSGSKPAPKKVAQSDKPIIEEQTVVDPDQAGRENNGYDNVPAGTIVVQTPQAGPNVKDAPMTPPSSVVIGDSPVVKSPSGSVMKPEQAPGLGVVAQTGASGAAATAFRTPSQGNSPADATAVAGESLKSKPSASPAKLEGAVALVPPVNAVVSTSPPTSAPERTTGQVNAPVVKIGALAATPAPPSSLNKGKSTASAQHPKFVGPTRKQPGIIARTGDLATEPEFRQAPRPAAAQGKLGQTSSKPVAANKPAPPPARVHQQEARRFAAQTSAQQRWPGLTRPDPRTRLPRSIEKPNPEKWREDDAPATPEDGRHIGLVLAGANPAFTPEGIPLRTDIPAGVSPLEKTGVDKPLWRRLE